MAVIYPQVSNASNPPTSMGSPGPVGMVPSGGGPSGLSRYQVEKYLDSVKGQGLFGTVMNLPTFRDQILSQIPESSGAVPPPPPRVPLSPPADYDPGFDPAFNYFDSNPQADAAVDSMMAQGGSQPVAMEEGGLVGEAKRVQQQGRNGDTMLVHMNPDEYNAMMALGGLGGLVTNGATINPETGLPEMFKFKDILPTIVGVAGAAFGLPTWAVALGTGATTAITTGDIGKGILSGLGSYALGSLFSDIGASGVTDAAATQAASAGTGAGAGAGTSVAQQAAMNVPPAITPTNAPTLISSAPATDIGGSLLATPTGGFGASAPSSMITGAGGGGLGGGFGGGAGSFNVGGNVGSSLAVSPDVSSLGGFNVGGNVGSSLAVRPDIASLAATPVASPPVAPPPAPALTPDALAAAKSDVFSSAPMFDSAAGPSRMDLFGEGISKLGTEGGVGYFDAATKGLSGLGMSAAGAGLFDPEPVDYSMYRTSRRTYNTEPVAPLQRELLDAPEDYRPGFDPAFRYFAADGKRGELDMTMGGLIPDQARNAVVQSAQQIASNAMPQVRPTSPAMYSPNAALRAVTPTVRMANGGVPEDMAMAGLMEVASDEVKNNLEERMSVPSAMNEPQNAEERIVYDNAMLAVQGILDPEPAQQAIQDFIETFGYDAYEALVASANEPRDKGGVIKPANGETTVADGAVQGEDVIAGMIVDPQTGEASANLRVGENEYVEPADSLTRRAKAAGLPPTPKNGAMVRSMEEDQLMAAYG